MIKCASCGKYGDEPKICNACKLVKYCGVHCQLAHRPQHKKECRIRAAELHDEALFKQPPSREDCPICFLELSFDSNSIVYKSCCGKIICNGCVYATREESKRPMCPFCRTREPLTDEEQKKRLERRMELNDPEAMLMMGHYYFTGVRGVNQDIDKAFHLFHRAAGLGSTRAHFHIGLSHLNGDGVPVNKKKAKHHWELAAISGDMSARHNLGAFESREKRLNRAGKHFMISASAGHDGSLKSVQVGYRKGLITKDEFAKTLRAHKKAKDELRSEWRDKSAAARDQDVGYHQSFFG